MLLHHLLSFGRDGSRSTEQTGSPLLFEPIALSLGVERGTLVQQTVQDSRGQDVVVEVLAPIQEALVAGDYVEYAEMSSAELAVSTSAKPPVDLVRFC